ncbi:MAG TPA: orotate phosphoribosyltransferase [Burkholderiales bacterium]
MLPHQRRFLDLALRANVLRFGEFTLKSGRSSPYFFNAGRFDSGAALLALSECYADALEASGLAFDMLFGPAYKGIPLVAAVAIALAESGRNVRYSFNRKEAKDHGEGGTVIGAPLAGRVLIVDDVISAGTSVRESVDLIRTANAVPCAVVIALDRMERGSGPLSAVQEVRVKYNIPVISIATLDDLMIFLGAEPQHAQHFAAVGRYRDQYGVTAHA